MFFQIHAPGKCFISSIMSKFWWYTFHRQHKPPSSPEQRIFPLIFIATIPQIAFDAAEGWQMILIWTLSRCFTDFQFSWFCGSGQSPRFHSEIRSLRSENFATRWPKVHHCACVCGVVTASADGEAGRSASLKASWKMEALDNVCSKKIN